MYTSPNNKSYIGQTCRLKQRQSRHRGRHNDCVAFATAISKYGYDNFVFVLLEDNLTIDEANAREEFYIAHYNTLSPNGYNLHTGGRNHTISEETRARQCAAQQGKKDSEETRALKRIATAGENNPMYGRTKESAPAFGRRGELHPLFGSKWSEERKSDYSKRFSGENSPLFGMTRSDEQKRQHSEFMSGDKNPNKKLWLITFPDGHEETMLGIILLCEKYDLKSGSMSLVANGKRTAHKGFRCRILQ
jgi:group I intron endonuclease